MRSQKEKATEKYSFYVLTLKYLNCLTKLNLNFSSKRYMKNNSEHSFIKNTRVPQEKSSIKSDRILITKKRNNTTWFACIRMDDQKRILNSIFDLLWKGGLNMLPKLTWLTIQDFNSRRLWTIYWSFALLIWIKHSWRILGEFKGSTNKEVIGNSMIHVDPPSS